MPVNPKPLTADVAAAIENDREATLRRVATDLLNRRMTVDEAVDRLLDEMGRGGRILVLDETSFGLDPYLARMRYTLKSVPPGTLDDEIKKTLRSRVLVTENGKDFANPADMKKFYYGVIWLVSKGDDAAKAERVKQAMMTADFAGNLVQVVKM